MESLAEAERVVSLDTEAIKREVQSRAADVKELLFRQTPQARQMLRKLLDGKLELTPIESEGCCVYRFTGTGTYERLFSGEALETLERTVVAATDSIPVASPDPRGGSPARGLISKRTQANQTIGGRRYRVSPWCAESSTVPHGDAEDAELGVAEAATPGGAQLRGDR